MGEFNNIKPTLKKPTSMGKNYEKKFNSNMSRNNVSLEESEQALHEKEQSLKKKIFDLAKMESLVHGDEKLSSIYSDMAEDGEEMYGYHYNESIMNIIFNEYVLNSRSYLEKYKMAIPKEKKRRDKSGIKSLQKAGEEEMGKTPTQETQDHNNSLPGVVENDPTPPHSRTIDQANDIENLTHRTEKQYDTMEEPIAETTSAGGAAGAIGDSSRADGYAYVGPFGSKRDKELDKPAWNGGEVLESVKKSDYLSDPKVFAELHKKLNEGFDMTPTEITSEGLDSPNNDSRVPMAEDHLNNRVDKINFIIQNTAENGDTLSPEDFEVLKDPAIDVMYKEAEKLNKGIGEGIIDQEVETMASSGDNPTSMKMDAPMTSSTSMPGDITEDSHCRSDETPVAGKIAGEKGACRKKSSTMKIDPEDKQKNKHNVQQREKRMRDYENKVDNNKDQYGKELLRHREQTKKLKESLGFSSDTISEDKKSSSMVNLDRLKKDNVANFNAEKSSSTISDVIDMQDELMAKDQYTDVGDPQKLGKKIEDESLAENKGESFENKGNSTNDNNKEIPKRNLTNPEADDVTMDRGLGMQDIVYDNEPGERFEERMKKDMGDEIYDQRQKKMDHRASAPMYNKDTQPTDDGVKKDQFDKEVEGWNSRKGVDESRVFAKYSNEIGKTKFIDFVLSEAKEIHEINPDTQFKLNFDGLGNKYDNNINESHFFDAVSGSYYTNGEDIYFMSNSIKMNENHEVDSHGDKINEEAFNKFKHLIGYNPADHMKHNSTLKMDKWKV